MGAATQVTDLTDLRTDLFDLIGEPTGNTSLNTRADRYINKALHDIHIDPGAHWPWAIRRAVLLTHAPYTTGTVDLTAAARTTVTGTSTEWNTAVTGMGFNNARAGGKMTFSGSEVVHEVSTVGSDTSITLTARYVGDALSGASYVYFEDEYALATDWLRPVDMRNFDLDHNIPFLGPMEFRRYAVRNSYRQKPKAATWFQKGYLSSTTPQYRVALYPAPDNEYHIPYDYITSYLAVSSSGTEQTQLTATTDEPIIPLGFRHVISLKAATDWLLFKNDDTRYGAAKSEYEQLLQRMKGTSNIGEDRPRISVGIGKYFGLRRLGRFEINNEFDEIRDWRWR